MVRPARGHHPSVQLKYVLSGAGAGDGQGGEQILRGTSHRGDVAEIRGCSTESDISHRGGSEIEVDPFC